MDHKFRNFRTFALDIVVLGRSVACLRFLKSNFPIFSSKREKSDSEFSSSHLLWRLKNLDLFCCERSAANLVEKGIVLRISWKKNTTFSWRVRNLCGSTRNQSWHFAEKFKIWWSFWKRCWLNPEANERVMKHLSWVRFHQLFTRILLFCSRLEI